MSMVHIGHVRMRVAHFAMGVKVRVRFAGRIERTVPVLMMFVMHVGMAMRQGLMNMFVLVSLREMQPNTDSHQNAGDGKLHRDRLAERQDCGNAAEEWRGRKVCARSRCSEVAKGDDEQGKADAIAEEADHAGEHSGGDFWKRSANQNSEEEIEGAGNQTSQFDDLQRIGKRYLARQIVVEAPGDARTDNGKRPKHVVGRRGAAPGQYDSAGNEAKHAKRDAAIKILVKDEPCDQRG